MSILTDVRADTSNILADWQEAITFERCTASISTGGEEALTWSTNLVTVGDVQAVRMQRRAVIAPGGFEFSPEYQVFIRHGLDVKEGDRFTQDGFKIYVNSIVRDEDKLLLLGARRSKDAT